MEERLKVGDHVHAVSARETAPGRVRLEVDGVAEEMERLGGLDGGHLVRVAGGVEPLHVARTPGGTWVWHRGRARLVERAPLERRAPAPGPVPPPTAPGRLALPAGAVTPPMPAVVAAVLVGVGQAVSRGAPLVVVTAMKIETQLTAPRDGVVAAVSARVGARVRPGDVLVEIAPAGGVDGG